ncbi:MAG: exodeoxyribonuclease VII large subunit [Defluviitaleaceae bacterium]|nr:exodeoxyribonuclease VII large subunit [Defluviitaleaceae bacterium]
MSNQEQVPLTVTALTKYLKLKFDVDFHLQNLMLKGEVSNFKRHTRGHFYFTLKDEQTQISAVMFANSAKNVKFEPVNGMQVIVTGRVSLYEPSGTYAIHVSQMTEDGVGNLYVAFNQLKEKLAAQGLFSDQHKKQLPKLPKAIGIITSPTGAAIRDMVTTIRRRSPNVQIYLYPALVQGEAAAADIVNKIQQVNHEHLVDVIIVGRGGGSIEDLWAFNEEVVAQALFASQLPVISAVGHETDMTIADFVADVRAPTPTAAAELAAPHLVDVLTYLGQLKSRLNHGLKTQINFKEIALNRLSEHYMLKNPTTLFENRLLKLSQLEKNLGYSLNEHVSVKKQQLNHLNQRLNERLEQQLTTVKNEYTVMLTKLEMLNPLAVLKKGYAVVTDEAGNAIKEVRDLTVGKEISATLDQGCFKAKVTEVSKEK